ncbi:MAG: hypothetical protein NZM10_03900, partial [Fimbriimonadales bacterium]|nr:hypothetical protein [Fimbriimonadales bacterium]
IAAIHAELTQLLSLGRERLEAIYALWNARDCSIGRAYRVLDLPDQPLGIALRVAPDFRLHLRLTNGKEHNTYHVSAV